MDRAVVNGTSCTSTLCNFGSVSYGPAHDYGTTGGSVAKTPWDSREIGAGFLAGLTAIPTALATGLLVFGSLGAGFVEASTAAAIYSLLVGGLVVGLAANSSPIIPVPLIGPNLILANLVVTAAAILSSQPHAGTVIVVAAALCVLLSGLWQILLGGTGFAFVVNYVPYPVLAGFLNGIAVLTIVSQLRPQFTAANGSLGWPEKPAALLFIVVIFLLIANFPALAARIPRLRSVPAALAALAIGVVIFAAAHAALPTLDLGHALGTLDIRFPPSFTLAPLWAPGVNDSIKLVLPEVVIHSLAVAGVATIETFFAMRLVQNVADIDFTPRRQILAFGGANLAAACAGGLTVSGQPSLTMMAVGAGGRTRVTPLVMALTVFLIGILFSDALSVIPVAVLSAILIATSLKLFDPWTLRLLPTALSGATPTLRKRAAHDFLIVATVMGITIFYSVIGGIIVGCVLACAIFILRMGRPVVQSLAWDDEVLSKRVHTAAQMAALAATPRRRVVVTLQGVLFFGNADNLADAIKRLQDEADIVVLDCGKITELDVSGANALRAIGDRLHRLGKQLHVCHVPPDLLDSFADGLKRPADELRRNIDATLEIIEQDLLREAGAQASDTPLPLGKVDIVQGMSEEELALLAAATDTRQFAAKQTLCQEGDAGDRMWLILAGSVSVTVPVPGGRTLRVASLGQGTTVGEMALIERGPRTATIVADEPVQCVELTLDAFDRLMGEHPGVASRLLANLCLAMTRRLRITTAELRAVSG